MNEILFTFGDLPIHTSEALIGIGALALMLLLAIAIVIVRSGRRRRSAPTNWKNA